MTFLWPDALFLLLLAPVLVAVHIRLTGWKNKAAARYAGLTGVRNALGVGSRFKRHIPPALFLIGSMVLVVAIARPTAVVTLPSERGTVMLTMDVSGSMQSTDVDPDRITAAQKAAKAFVRAQPSSTRIGIVAFAATAFLVQTPTLDRDEAIGAIDRFQTQHGTAVGSGIMVALRTLYPDIQFDDLAYDDSFGRRGGGALGAPKDGEPEFQPVAPGSNTSDVIVLMTDGRTNSGVDPIEAARVAANHGIRVFTVGFGASGGTIAGFGGRSMYMQPDEDTLKQIAAMTRGQFFHASSDTDLTNVFQGISTKLVMEKQKTEITAFFVAAATIVMLLSALLSLLWFNRIA